MTHNTSTSTSTSTAPAIGITSAPLTGSALIAHAERYITDGSRSAMVREAGYVTFRENGTERLQFVDFYEALLSARRGETEGRSTPIMRAWLALPSGEPIGPVLPIVASSSDACMGEHGLAAAMQWANDHAEEILRDVLTDSHAQGPDALLMISDRSGAEPLAEVWSRAWEGPHGITHTVSVETVSALPEGIEECRHCGALTTDGELGTVDGEIACSTCHDDSVKCADCGEHFNADDMTETHPNGDEVCPRCLDRYYSRCEASGEWFPDDDTVYIYGGGIWLNGRRCERINRETAEELHDDGVLWLDDDGDYTAEQPEDEDDNDDDNAAQGPDAMRRYGYNTDANDTLRHQIPQTGHTYGAEVEYKGDPSDWGAVAAACRDRAILTNDSTVSGELVSVALTAGQMRRWLANVTDALAGTRNDSETGMHIHIDRRALTPWQWHTLSHYAAQHTATFEAIAGRQPNQWQDFGRLPASDWPTFARNWRNRCWPTRYAGMNFTKGPTVEVRICRATKTKSRALARFSMVQRLIALGRLAPSQRPQSAAELQGWLAQDANIRTVTGWEIGTYNYKEAAQGPTVETDHQPTPPTPEAIQSLRDRIRRLEADEALTDRLRYNARTRYGNAPGTDATYERSAYALLLHYRAESARLCEAVRQARAELDAAQSLASIGTLNR